MSLASKAIAFFLIFGSLSCTRNIFRDFVHKTDTKYLLDQARFYVDDLNFNSAISNLEIVYAREPDNEQAIYLLAVAFAGRAGLRVLDLFSSLGSDSGSKTLFQIFAEHFAGADDDDIDDMLQAVTYFELLGATAADREGDQNFFALWLYWGHIGVHLNRYAYDADNALLTANFSACHRQVDKDGVKTGLLNNSVDVVMTSLAKIVDTAGSLDLSGAGFDEAMDLSSITDLFPGGLPSTAIPCSDDSEETRCLLMRSIVNNTSTPFGLGTGAPFTPEDVACSATTP